jgi:Acetyltransferase (GNAT) domain
MEFFVLNIKEKKEWNKCLKSLEKERQDIYYSPEYYSLYEKYGDGEANCFVFKDKSDIAIYPFLKNPIKKYGLCVKENYYDIQGAYGYNGVVSSSVNQTFIDDFYFHFNKYCSDENIIAEFTRFHPLLKNHLFSDRYIDVIKNRKVVYINLEEEFNEILANYKKSTRQEQKWGRERYKFELQVFEQDTSALNDFMYIYNQSMQRVDAINYMRFNKEYFCSLIKDTNTALFFILYKGKRIATGIVLIHKNYLSGHLGGTLNDFLSFSPNSYLYSEMIKFGKKRGCKYFFLGGGTSEDINDSLLKYKLNFSKKSSWFFIGKRIHNKIAYTNLQKEWESSNPSNYKLYNKQILGYHNA